jgi:hypothetical protein
MQGSSPGMTADSVAHGAAPSETSSRPGPIVPDVAVKSDAVRSDLLRPGNAARYGSRRGGRDDGRNVARAIIRFTASTETRSPTPRSIPQ